MSVRGSGLALGCVLSAGLAAYISVTAGAQTVPSFKVAYYNIQAGKGEPAIAGHPVEFVDSHNCTDPTQPMNASGTGLVQSHLVSSLGNDPRVLALGLGEAWFCGSPQRVRAALGWKAATTERNGVAMVARYGFAGPEDWQQLDTSQNPNPIDTMWVLRMAVCMDEPCGQTVNVFVAHWMGADVPGSLDRQGQQTIDFLKSRGGQAPHVFVGDLNAWEGVPVCSQVPDSGGLAALRNAGYIDAWRAIHGDAEGFTGMVNRGTCGIPPGYPFKRIDYAWSPPGYQPLSMQRFGMVPPGDGAPSDHYGIIAEYPWPGAAPLPAPPPAPTPTPTPAPLPTPTTSPAATADVVLHTKNASTIAGAWRLALDSTAAGGATLHQPNAGAPKVAAALPSPQHYFELGFNAQAGVGYRLWLRGRADDDFYYNDSVYVQFSGSVTALGAADARIGTASATTVVLEDCGGCPLNGWGWQDNGYGRGVLGPLVYFATTGPQTIRVQAREDGIAIDQIVLSPARYHTQPPGSVTSDHTIVPLVAPAREEILIRASAATTIAGGWRMVADPTAAGQTAVRHPDAALPRINEPLAVPQHFVEFTFEADAGRPYRLWLRGRADGDVWTNDSVHVQFSGTVTAAGAPIFRLGTDSATQVNLEDGSNAGLVAWGWQDNGYGAGVLGPLVTFASGGRQTIRIQTREDGLRIDQIVLSSRTYLTTAPGALHDDRTIIP